MGDINVFKGNFFLLFSWKLGREKQVLFPFIFQAGIVIQSR